MSWSAGEPRQGTWTERVPRTVPYPPYNYTEDVTFHGAGALTLAGANNIVSDIPAGQRIVSATMKIRRDASAGTSGAVTCTLYQHGFAGAPTGEWWDVLFAPAASPVSIAPNQEYTITLNASAVTNLNNGTCKGFGFRDSGGYARYDIYGELTVTYGY